MGVSPVMRVLQLTKKVPFPSKDGESMAILSLASSLVSNGLSVDLLSLNTNKHKFSSDLDDLDSTLYRFINMVDINTNFHPISFLINLLSNIPYQISRFVKKDYKVKLISLLNQNKYDYILLETVYLTPYIPLIKRYSSAKVLLRTHNMEYEIWERLYKGANWGVSKLLYKWLAHQMFRYESFRLHDIDYLIAISDRELLMFKAFYPSLNGIVVPITWNASKERYQITIKSNAQNISLFFIGSLDWKPNQEGLIWFLSKVWPLCYARFPHLTFYVAGRNMPEKIKQLNIDGVIMMGEVKDASSFVNQHDIAIVPLLSGSGMRAKIIEAMALGKVIITTSIGLEGIEAKDTYDVCLADSPEDFVNVIEFLLIHPNQMMQIGINARYNIMNNYESVTIGKKLLDFLDCHFN
ncbi:MAG: glycosyltransferase family 4 protein [Haliscomenobacter sp.]|nr:glycosyltransferase family 4 protein [Haliscomenobacter sp.]